MSANAAVNWIRANKPGATALVFGESGDRRTDGTTRYQNKYDPGFITEALRDAPLSMPQLDVESVNWEAVVADLEPDLWYRLGEASGSTANETGYGGWRTITGDMQDQVGSNDLTPSGSPVASVTSYDGNALIPVFTGSERFDGDSTGIDVDGGATLVLEAVIANDKTGATFAHAITAHNGASPSVDVFGKNNDSNLRVKVSGTGGVSQLTVSSVLTTGTRKHVLIAVDSTNTTVWVDGAKTTTAHGVTGLYVSDEMIVANSLAGTNAWGGTVEQVRVYSGAASDAWAAARYASYQAGTLDTADAGGPTLGQDVPLTTDTAASTAPLNGTYGSGVTLDQPGGLYGDSGRSANFDESANGKVTLPTIVPTTRTLSFSAWVYLDSASASGEFPRILSLGRNDATYPNGLEFYCYSADDPTRQRSFGVIIPRETGNLIVATGNDKFNEDEWVHLAATVDTTDLTETGSRFWVNGVEEVGTEVSSGAGSYDPPDLPAVIGQRSYDSARGWLGNLQDVMMWDGYALTDEDVSRLYGAGTLTAARAQDSVGDLHMTAYGSPAVNKVGPFGEALVTDFSTVTSTRYEATLGTPSYPLTMICKCNVEHGTATQMIGGIGNANWKNFIALGLSSGEAPRMEARDTSANAASVQHGSSVEGDGWGTWAVVTTDGVDYDFYYNGSLVGSDSLPSAPSLGAGTKITFGSAPTGGANHLSVPASDFHYVAADLSASMAAIHAATTRASYESLIATAAGSATHHAYSGTDTTIQTADVLYPDRSGNGNVWVGSGTGVTRQVDDASGRPLAIELDGQSGTLESGTGAFTPSLGQAAEFVLKIDTSTNYDLFTNYVDANNFIHIRSASGRVAVEWSVSGVVYAFRSNASALSNDTWHSLMVRISDAGTGSVWVDGVDDTQDQTATLTINTAVGAWLGSNGGTSTFLDGTIAHFDLIDNDLAEARIIQHAIAAHSAGDATLSGSPTIVGDKIVLNGVDEYATTDVTHFDIMTEYTMLMVATPTSFPGSMNVMDKRDGPFDGTGIYYSGSNAAWSCRHNSETITLSSYAEQARVPVVLAATWDGSTLSMYVDGVFQDSVAVSTALNTTADLRLGARAYIIDNYFSGSIGPGVIINAALDAQEVKELTSILSGDGFRARPDVQSRRHTTLLERS